MRVSFQVAVNLKGKPAPKAVMMARLEEWEGPLPRAGELVRIGELTRSVRNVIHALDTTAPLEICLVSLDTCRAQDFEETVAYLTSMGFEIVVSAHDVFDEAKEAVMGENVQKSGTYGDWHPDGRIDVSTDDRPIWVRARVETGAKVPGQGTLMRVLRIEDGYAVVEVA